ncbi:MAG: hypothetical protein IM606_09900 [Cytophagales bacterium]|nr:hypothetical protein [Cytophagales bacterium]MCA6485946.1 hypothetical protein [Chitinophagaceae bacterium]
MANQAPIQTILCKKALARLQNKLPMTATVNKDFQAEVADSQKRHGGTVNIEKPPVYNVRSGEIMEVQSTVVPVISTTLSMFGVDVSASQLDLQVSYDAVQNGMYDGVLDGAASALAAKIEADGFALALKVANTVGTPGTAITDPSILSTAGALITSNGGDISNRIGLLNSFQNASFASGVKNYFNPVNTVSDAYAKGMLGNGYGFDLYDEPVAGTFTAGTYGGTPLTNGVLVEGNTIVTDGWTATTTSLNVGDTFTIAGCFNRNPQTGLSTGELKRFVVATKTVTDGSGNSTITIGEDGIILNGPRQNVINASGTSVIADNSAITVTSGASGVTSKQSLVYHKNAFTFAMVPLAKVPSNLGVMSTVVQDKMSGLSISMKEAYSIETNQRVVRFDVLYTWLETYPQIACRILG